MDELMRCFEFFFDATRWATVGSNYPIKGEI